MGEGPIIEGIGGRAIGIGFQFQWHNDPSIFVVLPFFMFTITFKRKTEYNDWYRFINTF